MLSANTLIPRLPVGGWHTFSGAGKAPSSCILDAPGLTLTTSGRASIVHALRLLGVREGDNVLVPTYHCPTMIAPITGLGARPVFFPITDTGSVNLDFIRAQSTSPRPRAIIAAHYFGFPQPMAALRKWCDDSGVALIEDCAHALFGKNEGRAIGRWGDYSIASLPKFLPLVEGGCLVCNGPKAPELQLQARGVIDDLKSVADLLENAARHRRLFGINTLLGALFALKRRLRHTPDAPTRVVHNAEDDANYAALDYQQVERALPRVSTWMAHHIPRGRIVDARRNNYRRLVAAFTDISEVCPLLPALSETAAPYVFPLWIDKPDPAYERLRAAGIPVFRWNWLWPGTPQLAGDAGMLWSHHVFQLPCHQDLRDEDLAAIIESVKMLARQ